MCTPRLNPDLFAFDRVFLAIFLDFKKRSFNRKQNGSDIIIENVLILFYAKKVFEALGTWTVKKGWCLTCPWRSGDLLILNIHLAPILVPIVPPDKQQRHNFSL